MKKKIKTKNIIIWILMGVVILLLSFILFLNIVKNTSFLSSIEILGQNFELQPGIYVYEFDIDDAVINKDDSGTGCNPEYNYEVSKIYENTYDTANSINFFVEGQTYGDFRIKFVKAGKTKAYYYFTLNFNEPLKVATGC